ncbi:hypothetical protein H6F96_29845 [Microcoleus sp. FACHB-53]|jgi:hypothetical protein|nr:hypothetical protein [Microcoleus sp. FACHB-53]MBD2128651.1 hypothetical protein [Microcoleus sp. FACHB-1]
MLKRIWQWLKGLFRRLFGGGTSSQSSSYRNRIHSSSSGSHEGIREQQALPPLADSDYEYLFRQLLEGVGHGWDQQRVSRWFEGLQGRITEADWVAWLRRFGERVLASAAPNDELAMRLVHLADQVNSIPSLHELGNVAYQIGSQLLNRNTNGAIWEYEGPDGLMTQPFPDVASLEPEGEQTDEDTSGTETITLDELLVRLQQDPNLLQVVAQQLGIETNEPQVIIEELLNQFSAAAQPANDEAEA